MEMESAMAEAESSLCNEEISAISCSLRSDSALSTLAVLCSGPSPRPSPRPSPGPVGLLSAVLSNRKSCRRDQRLLLHSNVHRLLIANGFSSSFLPLCSYEKLVDDDTDATSALSSLLPIKMSHFSWCLHRGHCRLVDAHFTCQLRPPGGRPARRL
ncbi:hypothetical protein EYF80_035722 [Liparis tanakae]|uniref:Uncharacterized protein n=1 Tax=Liparis tanakae TaxID=230148 RepID=A0A4Z2GLK0_9TELE|nr:hypothetical protein EYF80_035722 [Liparis tanakae]